MNKIVSKPVFWLGTSAIVGAYYLSSGSAPGASTGLQNGIEIIALAGGIALIIYAIRST